MPDPPASMPAKLRHPPPGPPERDSGTAPPRSPPGLLGLARRRRLSVYLIAFATMLAMSSLLDVRRASLRRAAGSHVHIVAPQRRAALENGENLPDDALAPIKGPPAFRPGLLEDERVPVRGPLQELPPGAPGWHGLQMGQMLEGNGGGPDVGKVAAERTGGAGGPERGGGNVLGGGAWSMVGRVGAADGGAGSAGEVPRVTPSLAAAVLPPTAISAEELGPLDQRKLAEDSPAEQNPTKANPLDPKLADPKLVDPNLSAQELKDEVDQLIAHVEEEESIESESKDAMPPHYADGIGKRTGGGDSVGNGQVVEGQARASPAEHPARNFDHQSAVIAEQPVVLRPADSPLISVQLSNAGGVANLSHTAAEVDGASLDGDGMAPANEMVSANVSMKQPELRLSVEELFKDGQSRLATILANEKNRSFMDENDLRIVQALELQATRGDCEQPSASEGGSLFKSDAEAASSLDIEKTDPLYGAWCIFMGTYKSDAMRDFATKLAVVEAGVVNGRAGLALAEHKLKTDGDGNGGHADSATVSDSNDVSLRNSSFAQASVVSTSGSEKGPFDSFAAQLLDVMDMETQTMLSGKLQFLRSHLQENELRYIAALSLQSTFGSCGPYGEELGPAKKAKISNGLPHNDAGQELRLLTEPLTGETAQRREGALWGSWCVLIGKRRNSAAAELVDRITLLLQQLAKKQAAAAAVGQDFGPVEEVDLKKPLVSRISR